MPLPLCCFICIYNILICFIHGLDCTFCTIVHTNIFCLLICLAVFLTSCRKDSHVCSSHTFSHFLSISPFYLSLSSAFHSFPSLNFIFCFFSVLYPLSFPFELHFFPLTFLCHILWGCIYSYNCYSRELTCLVWH
jgi:hypothetical protein